MTPRGPHLRRRAASCGIDATNKEAMDTLVRPTFAGIHKAGVNYVKVDLLRHYLYDNLHHTLQYCAARGVTPAQMYRKYLSTVREELGRDTFLLSCWGVLPESVGLADACRIATDGYGPASMQQYNSWNGIVWRNDPDLCDVYPQFKPAEVGNVTKTDKVALTKPTTRSSASALASISGSMLLLSDKPDVYRDDRNIEGARRAAPVLFSVPGQLYDFDERHSSTVATMPRESITAGASPAPCDADQFGTVCPWWLNEFDVPGVGHWNVLHRSSIRAARRRQRVCPSPTWDSRPIAIIWCTSSGIGSFLGRQTRQVGTPCGAGGEGAAPTPSGRSWIIRKSSRATATFRKEARTFSK